MVIDGKAIAQEILNKLKQRPVPKKQLAAVLFGEESASVSFLKQKEKFAKELGVDFRLYKPEHTKPCVLGRAHTESMCSGFTNEEARQEVLRLAESESVGGLIVQLPLPEHIDRQYVLNAIPREKDVDVLSRQALGGFYVGENSVLPPAVEVVIEILNFIEGESSPLRKVSRSPSGHGSSEARERGRESSGRASGWASETPSFRGASLSLMKVAVVGLGFLVGKPIATWLTGKCAEFYLLDQGSDLSALKQADLVISGVGKAGLIKPEMLKDGAGVIDFGYEYFNSKEQSANSKSQYRGDFDSELLATSPSPLAFYTPTPGGTGPILVAKLFENFYKLN